MDNEPSRRGLLERTLAGTGLLSGLAGCSLHSPEDGGRTDQDGKQTETDTDTSSEPAFVIDDISVRNGDISIQDPETYPFTIEVGMGQGMFRSSDNPNVALHAATTEDIVIFDAESEGFSRIDRPVIEIRGAGSASTTYHDGQIHLSTGVHPFTYDLEEEEWLSKSLHLSVSGRPVSPVEVTEHHMVQRICDVLVVTAPGWENMSIEQQQEYEITWDERQRGGAGQFPVFLQEQIGTMEWKGDPRGGCTLSFRTSGDTVFASVTWEDPELVAFNLWDAETEWHLESTNIVQVRAVDGNQLFGTDSGFNTLIAKDTSTGENIWTFSKDDSEIAARYWASGGLSDVSDDHVVFRFRDGGDDSGYVSVLDRTDGNPVFEMGVQEVPAGTNVGYAQLMDGNLFLADMEGVEIFDVASGRSLGTWRSKSHTPTMNNKNLHLREFGLMELETISFPDAELTYYSDFSKWIYVDLVNVRDTTLKFKVSYMNGEPVADATVYINDYSWESTTSEAGTFEYDPPLEEQETPEFTVTILDGEGRETTVEISFD